MLFFGHFDFLPVLSPVFSSSSFLILHMLSFWTPVLMAPTSIPLGIISLQSKPWVPAPVANWTFCFSFWNIRSLKSRFALLSEHFPSSLAFPIAMCESSLKHQHRNSWKFFVPYKGPLPPPPTPLYCSLTPAPHSFSLTNVFISAGAFISLLPTFPSIPYSGTDELLYAIWMGSLFYINCVFPLKATSWTFLFFFFLTCFQTPFPVIAFQPWRHLLS